MIETLQIEHVEFIPEEKEEGVLYISLRFRTSSHLCACGCGQLVVLPFDKFYGWKYTESEGKVSFSPSIGNFSFACKSHYYIRNNQIVWA